ncbi:MAG: flagellar basal-body rod protein FlgG [Bacillota bacterium]|nr:flagellar basal-body rod protein FlgG [Bacillota bacterium]MDW7682991.1 flagellar basal-body rod protein FlgG [Bacillota bacterium]
MLRGLWNAATGMRAQQQKIDVTANNIANVNTTGFKKKSTVFRDLVYQSIERKGNAAAPARAGQNPSTVGVGSAVASIRSDFAPGSYVQTDRSADLAIVGEGFFQVTLPAGRTAYTRDGGFSRDSAGHFVTQRGLELVFPDLPGGEYDIHISPEGTVTAVYPNEETLVLGSLELAYFSNPHGLEQIGDNVLAATEASGEPAVGIQAGNTRVLQGYLEGSNVDLGEEMVRLVTGQRAFELNSRALRTADEMWSIANQLRR